MFDLENIKINEEQYIKEVTECIEKNIIPQLERIETKEGIIKIAEKNPVVLNMLPLKVKSFWGIQ